MTDDELKEKLMAIDWPDFGSEIAKSAGKPDWRYRDQGWMTMADWDRFIDIAGEENIAFVASSVKGDKARGQFLISPAGIERVKAYAA